MTNGIDKSKLSDLDLTTLPKGFTPTLENGKPVAVIATIEYCAYINQLMGQVRQYVEQIIGV